MKHNIFFGKNHSNALMLITEGLFFIIMINLMFSFIRYLISISISSNTSNINHEIQANFIMIIFPIIISPIFEELIFRKWLPDLFKKKFSGLISVLFSNILFTILHFDLFFFTYFINGLLYSKYFRKSNNIVIPITIHSLYNLFVYIISR